MRKTLHYDGEHLRPDLLKRLNDLAASLEPVGLADQVRSLVFGSGRYWDTSRQDRDRTAEAFQLGQLVVEDPDALASLLPDLVSKVGNPNFGSGLASKCSEPMETWNQFIEQMSQTPDSLRKPQILSGYLSELSKEHPDIVQQILDDAVAHPVLGPLFLELQTAVPLEQLGVERVHRAAELGLVPLHSYRHIHWWGGDSAEFGDSDLAQLVLKLSESIEGLESALELLSWRFKKRAESDLEPGAILVGAGRKILSLLTPESISNNFDYDLGVIALQCLKGDDGESSARHLCQTLKQAVNSSFNSFETSEVLDNLAEVQPLVLLNELLTGPDYEFFLIEFSFDVGSGGANFIDHIPLKTLVDWGAEDPRERFSRMARVARIFHRPTPEGPIQWSPLALAMLGSDPDKKSLLSTFFDKLRPRSWSGSRAEIMEARLPLLQQLLSFSPEFSDLVNEESERLRTEIVRERESELNEHREHFERFE